MKRLLIVLLCTLLWPHYYALSQITDKALKKEYKTTLKQLKKETWKVYASSTPLESALMQYFKKREAAPMEHIIIGHGTGRNNNIALPKARTNAQRELATMLETQIDHVGEVEIKDGKIAVNSTTSARSEQILKDISPALTLVRKTKDGDSEARVYYIIKLD